MQKVFDIETYAEIAKKIWNNFQVGASCTVYGFVRYGDELVPKGKLVLEELERLDVSVNIRKSLGQKGRMRKYVYRKDSVGGPIAHKIFSWEKRIVDSEIRYTIWRFQ